jgi:hypothetical protein
MMWSVVDFAAPFLSGRQTGLHTLRLIDAQRRHTVQGGKRSRPIKKSAQLPLALAHEAPMSSPWEPSTISPRSPRRSCFDQRDRGTCPNRSCEHAPTSRLCSPPSHPRGEGVSCQRAAPRSRQSPEGGLHIPCSRARSPTRGRERCQSGRISSASERRSRSETYYRDE